ncbi:MAG TPA: hypothetical protein VGO06_01710 [Bosea sp. (in: a-proteobacteria)]|jgi:hypothetical protein|uniref:hypothetical protein n=1 Tax=Bosea sp. (in: a-proteobacteria) TaxID=1871050 RepID=UPI002E15ED3F|nr:hypothetical protein [Bosea sp. (in: a-proteobacteria)]
MGQQIEQRPFRVQEFRGYALNFAARLEASVQHTILRLLQASNLSRTVFFAAAAGIDLDRPEAFLAQIEARAADVLADFHGLAPNARIARALALMTPRMTLECVFGACPDGLLGLFGRFGSQPLYDPESYRLAFELFSRPENRHRAKVLGQLPGQIRPEHVMVVASLDDVLVHRAVLERVRRGEVAALNAFAQMIVDRCDATPELIRESLDALAVGTTGVRIDEWVQGWLARQVRLAVDPPIPADDPHLRLRVGGELASLGRRFRNCAGQRMGGCFAGDHLIYEFCGDGEEAVIELERLTSGSEVRWLLSGAFRARNRRISPTVALAIQEKLDQFGILCEPLMLRQSADKALHNLIDYEVRPAWDERIDATKEPDDESLDHLLDLLDDEVNGRDAA